MIEKILGLGTGITLTDLGALAALTTIIVQVLKNILPKKVPTQIVTIIVGLALAISASLVYFSSPLEAIGIGAVVGLVSAFAAMNGFDALKSIWLRFNPVEGIDTDEPQEDPEAPVAEEGEEGEKEETGGEG